MKKAEEQLAKRNLFVERNLGLVHLCANRFRGKGVDYDDLYAAGCVGLIKAADGFDVSRGLQFSTYAVPVILGEIKKLYREGGAIRVGRKLRELSFKVSRLREEYLRIYGTEPSVSVLAEKLGVSAEDITQAILAGMPVGSLTVSENEEDAGEQWDVPVESFEETLPEKLSLQQAVAELDEEDRNLIYLRYHEEKTQAQTAEILGTSQVQISRREKKILLHLRQQLEV